MYHPPIDASSGQIINIYDGVRLIHSDRKGRILTQFEKDKKGYLVPGGNKGDHPDLRYENKWDALFREVSEECYERSETIMKRESDVTRAVTHPEQSDTLERKRIVMPIYYAGEVRKGEKYGHRRIHLFHTLSDDIEEMPFLDQKRKKGGEIPSIVPIRERFGIPSWKTLLDQPLLPHKKAKEMFVMYGTTFKYAHAYYVLACYRNIAAAGFDFSQIAD